MPGTRALRTADTAAYRLPSSTRQEPLEPRVGTGTRYGYGIETTTPPSTSTAGS